MPRLPTVLQADIAEVESLYKNDQDGAFKEFSASQPWILTVFEDGKVARQDIEIMARAYLILNHAYQRVHGQRIPTVAYEIFGPLLEMLTRARKKGQKESIDLVLGWLKEVSSSDPFFTLWLRKTVALLNFQCVPVCISLNCALVYIAINSQLEADDLDREVFGEKS